MRVSLGMFIVWLLMLGFIYSAFGVPGVWIAALIGAVLTFSA